MSDLDANVPAYLRDGDADGHCFGTLSYNRKSKCWVIRSEPCVTELAKRLFPGCDGRGRGVARFTAHRRVIGDLNWFMLRYRLAVRASDAKRWEESLSEARAHATRRRLNEDQPHYVNPPAGSFEGSLLTFQQEGLAFLIQNNRALLADEMGLGKTVQALAFLASSGQLPALIVVPAHLTRNWQREAERFLRPPARVHIIRGLTPYRLPDADIYLIHYLLLRGWKKALPEKKFHTVIFDEIQELRHAGTEKYSSASLLAGSAENVIGLSGTPIYNHGGEIWNIINILDYHMLGDWESFSREWCFGYNNNIVAKPELLGSYLRREGLMLRRVKRQVLTELPPKRRLVQEIDWDDDVYRRMMIPALKKLALLRSDIESASQRALIEEQICRDERQATGIAKAPYVAVFVKMLLDNGEKVLLFAHHHKVVDAYRKELKSARPVFITGREDERAKEASVLYFMDGRSDLCVISLRSASGLNLQRATCVVFGELDWSPAVHSQAEDRAHRIGQQDSLLCYYLVSPKGSDQDMQQALGLKVSQFIQLMGDAEPNFNDEWSMRMEARERVKQLIARLEGENKQ